jgi:hypothetical protein
MSRISELEGTYSIILCLGRSERIIAVPRQEPDEGVMAFIYI